MTLGSGTVSELAALMLREDQQKVILAGAAISSVEPSCLPDARSWVTGLVELLCHAAKFSPPEELRRDLEMIDQGTGRLIIPLEGVFSAVEAVRQGAGSELAA